MSGSPIVRDDGAVIGAITIGGVVNALKEQGPQILLPECLPLWLVRMLEGARDGLEPA
jgi:hypothetical protein